jgi:hypothetical protein
VLSHQKGIILLVIAAFIAISTAFAHLSCIYFGPQCYSAQMAPASIVQSAQEGTLLAPLGTVFVSAIFIVFGGYALSGAGLIRRLPLISMGIYSIALVSVIRGILPLQLYLRHPEKVSMPVLYVGIVWLLVGMFYFSGYRAIDGQKV